MILNVCAFVAGPDRIPHMIIKHVLACARDEICSVGELHIFKSLLTCVNSVGKQNGLVHRLHAMLVHSLRCKYMNAHVNLNRIVMCVNFTVKL